MVAVAYPDGKCKRFKDDREPQLQTKETNYHVK